MPPPVGTVAGDSGGDFAKRLGDHGADCVFRRCRRVRQTTASSPPEYGQPLAGARREPSTWFCAPRGADGWRPRVRRPDYRTSTTVRRGDNLIGRANGGGGPCATQPASGRPPQRLGRAGSRRRAERGVPSWQREALPFERRRDRTRGRQRREDAEVFNGSFHAPPGAFRVVSGP